MFKYVTISKNKFGEYVAKTCDDQVYDDESDILDLFLNDVYSLNDEIPESIENIKGMVTGEPKTIYAEINKDGRVTYFGVIKV